jgi:hypothetical protein
MILDKEDSAILLLQDTSIRDCKQYRQEWERTALEVDLSYKGIKFPMHNRNGDHRNDPNSPVYVNIVKRQHRAINNFLLNNEPGISVRRTQDMTHEDVEKTTMLLRRQFIDSDFYDEDMDDIIDYWLKRWVVYVLSYMNKDGEIIDKVMDPMDCYIDISARRKKDIRFVIDTFTKSVEEAKDIYKTDKNGVEINWDAEVKAIKKAESDEKNRIIKEPVSQNVIMFREGCYLDKKNWETVLVKVLTTKTRVIKMDIYESVNFLPLNWFDPINDRDNLYNDSWYKWVLAPEREVNKILSKFVHIVNTGWRYVYVREGTKITKGKNKLLESLGIEVIEIGAAQEVPRPAELLTISNSQMALLERMMRQAEEEWGMRQDVMWESSLWKDASGRAIEALQAGSRGNIGMAVMQLNKFMNRLAKTHLQLYKVAWPTEIKVVDGKTGQVTTINPKKLGIPKLHIEPRSAFYDIVRKQDALTMIDFIFKFKPDTKLNVDTIIDIFGMQNDLAEKIMYDIKDAENPDLKAAEASIQLLLAGRKPAVSKDDNHEIHMAMLTKVMSDMWENMPEPIQKNMIDKYRIHEAHMWGTPQWNPE